MVVEGGLQRETRLPIEFRIYDPMRLLFAGSTSSICECLFRPTLIQLLEFNEFDDHRKTDIGAILGCQSRPGKNPVL